MSLTLNDLLTPEQITAAESALQGEIEQLTTAEFEAIATIQAQFNQARAEARRRVLLAQLVPVTPAPAPRVAPSGQIDPVQEDTTEETPEEIDLAQIAQPEQETTPQPEQETPILGLETVLEQEAPEPTPSNPDTKSRFTPVIKTGLPEGMLTTGEAADLAGVPRGSWQRMLTEGGIKPAGSYIYNGKPAHYFDRASVLALGVAYSQRYTKIETVRGLPVVDTVPAGCAKWEDARKALGLTASTFNRRRAEGQYPDVAVLRTPGVKPMQWEKLVRVSGVQEPEKKPAPAPAAAPAPAPKAVIPEPEIDINLEGKWAAEEAGKRAYTKGFWILRRFVDGVAQYQAHSSQTEGRGMGWEPIEWHSKTGLSRWESCPVEPGPVGMHNGTTTGPVVALSPGGDL